MLRITACGVREVWRKWCGWGRLSLSGEAGKRSVRRSAAKTDARFTGEGEVGDEGRLGCSTIKKARKTMNLSKADRALTRISYPPTSLRRLRIISSIVRREVVGWKSDLSREGEVPLRHRLRLTFIDAVAYGCGSPSPER